MIPVLSNTEWTSKGWKMEENYAKNLRNNSMSSPRWTDVVYGAEVGALFTATAWGRSRDAGGRAPGKGHRLGLEQVGTEKRQWEITCFQSLLFFILILISSSSHALSSFQKHFIAYDQAGSPPEGTIDACLCTKFITCVGFNGTS